MRTATRKILIAVTALLAAVCLAFGAVALIAGNKLTVSDERVEAAGAMQDFDKTYTLKDGGGKTKAGIWSSEVLDTNNASTTSTIKILVILGENWDLDTDTNWSGGPLTVPASYDITLDLNGKTLSRTISGFVPTTWSTYPTDGQVIKVAGGTPCGVLTLTDSASGGTITGGASQNGGGIEVAGKLTIEKAKITGNSAWYTSAGISITGGEVTMNGGSIESNTVYGNFSGIGFGGAGGLTGNATFTLNGGKIDNNTALSGAAFYLSTGPSPSGPFTDAPKFIMNGGEITNHNSTDANYGGGALHLYVYNASSGPTSLVTYTSNAEIDINGGLIKGNSSVANGGAISMAAGVLNITGGTITGNTCTSTNASTIATYRSTVNISGGKIDGNTGCGILAVATALKMSGGTISNNTSPLSGGGIWQLPASPNVGSLELSGGYITGNSATTMGGGVYVAPGIPLKLSGPTVITGNTVNGAANNFYITIDSGAPNPTSMPSGVSAVVHNNSHRFVIAGPLHAGGKVTQIGITLSTYPTHSSATWYVFTQGYNFSATPGAGNIWTANYFFCDNETKGHVIVSSTTNWPSTAPYPAGTEAAIGGPAAHGMANSSTIPYEIKVGSTWYNLTNATDVAALKGTGGNGVLNDFELSPEINHISYTYSATKYVSGLRFTFTNSWGTASTNTNFGTSASMDTTNSSTPFAYYNDSFGNSSFPSGGAKKAGSYAFAMGDINGNVAFQGYNIKNRSINIVVNKKDAKVTIGTIPDAVYGKSDSDLATYLNPATPYWSATGVESGDTLGITLEKEWGTDVRSYVVRGKLTTGNTTNDNYNITFTNTGMLKIKPRPVRVVLNDDYATYGDPAYDSTDSTNPTITESNVTATASEPQPLVTRGIVTRTETTTAYKDDAGKAKDLNGNTLVSGYYKGGWSYPAKKADGTTNTTADDKFINDSLSASGEVEFFEYKWNTTLTAGTDYDTNDNDKYLYVRSVEANTADSTAYPNTYYEIEVKNTNKNYEVTFLKPDGTPFTTTNEGTFQLEVRRAEQVGGLRAVDKTPSGNNPKVGDYKGATYDGTAKTVALPDIALFDVVKGFKAAYPTGTPTNRGPLAVNTDGLASTTSYYKYWIKEKDKIVTGTPDTSKGEINLPTEFEKIAAAYTPAANETKVGLMKAAASYVAANATSPNTVTNKGTYTVYVSVDIPNHLPKVYTYEFKLDVSGTKYRIIVEQQKADGTVVSTLTEDSGGNYITAGASNSTLKATYDPDLKVVARVEYEWDWDTSKTEPTNWVDDNSTNDDKFPYVHLYYRGADATLGTPAHSNAWGYGYLSTDTGVDTNAVDDSGDKPVSGGGTTPRKLGYSGAPSEAGKYVVTLFDEHSESSNYNLVADATNGEKITFEIERKELKKPDAATAQGSDTGVYTGLAQTYAIVPKEETLADSSTYTYDMDWFTAGKEVGATTKSFDGSALADNLTLDTTASDDTQTVIKVTKAGEYGVALRLPLDNSYATDGTPNGTKPRNYKWEGETKDYTVVKLELKQKELQVNWKFLKDGSPSTATPGTLMSSYNANVKGEISTEWKGNYKPVLLYDNTGNPVPDPQDSSKNLYEEPVLQYYYKYITDKVDGTGTVAIGNLTTMSPAKIESLKDSTATHGAGVYVVGVRLSTATQAAKDVNANYKFDTTVVDTDPASDGKYNVSGKPYFKQIEITAGEADLNDIAILYQKGSEAEAEIDEDTEFVYSVNASGSAIGYKFNLNFDSIDYLDENKIVVTYQEWDGTQYVDISPNPASLTKAGKKYRVKFGIEVKSTDVQHQLPPDTGTGCYDTTATDAKFDAYERDSSDPKKGTLYYEVEIERAEVDLSKFKLEVQSGTSGWALYDETKPPKRTGLPYTVQVKAGATNMPFGVTSASVDTGSFNGNTTNPGKVPFEIDFDLDDNYKYTEYQKNPDGSLVLDGDNKPIVATVHTGTGLKFETYILIAKEQIKIKWKYAPLKDPSGNDIIDTTTGQPFRYRTLDVDSKYNGVYMCVYTYAGDTQEYYGAAGLNQLRLNNGIDSTNPQLINVEVRIVDNSSDLTKPQYQDQYEFASGNKTTTFTLGQKMYGVTVQVNHDAMEYSDAPVGAIYSLVPEDATFDESWCTVTLWKGTTNLGEYNPDVLATLDAGVYTVKFELIEAAQNTYLLSQDSFTFTVDQKELDVPELTANGVFNAKNQKLVDLLQVGKKSFNDAYKDLIAEGILVLGGDFDGRNAGDYEATITITSDNYIWKKSASSTAKLLKVSLADEELPKAEIDSTKKVASYEWSIAPFVITSDMVSKSKENGLELNLPEWIAALTAGEVPSLGWEQNVYESASSNSKLNGAEGFAFESGKEYYISVSLNGEDAKNFIFQDSKTNISNKVEYQVAVSGFSAAMTKALDFLKANWWWLLIILGAILFLILLIVLIKKHKKNKEAREEKRRLEEEKREEKERKERERQEEKERRELEKQEEKERREQERREEKERREEEERRRREEEERRRREEEERRRNTPIPIPMPQMAATMQSQLQAQPQMQAQPQPQQAQPQPQPQPQAQPKQQPQKPKKRPMPENGMVRGFVPNGDGTYSPVNIRMKKRGMPDYPTPQMPYPPMGANPNMGYPQYGADNRSFELRLAEERLKAAELRAAEDKARIAELNAQENRINARIAEERVRMYEDRAARSAEERAIRADAYQNANSGAGSNEMLSALLLAAMRGVGMGAPMYQQQPAVQQPTQPQPILITNQQPAQPQQPMSQDGRHVVPPGAVMTTTSTTTIDATKRQSPNGTAYEYDDSYDYGVFEQFDDKNN